MIAYSVIPEDVYADLPENNELKFFRIANAAHRNLCRILGDLENNGQGFTVSQWRAQYLAEMTSVANALGISLRLIENPYPDLSVELFDAQMTSVLTGIRLRHDVVADKLTIALSSNKKRQIAEAIGAIIKDLDQLDGRDVRIEMVRERLNQAIQELHKNRVRLVTLLGLESLGKVLTIVAAGVTLAADAPIAWESLVKGARQLSEFSNEVTESQVSDEQMNQIESNLTLEAPKLLKGPTP